MVRSDRRTLVKNPDLSTTVMATGFRPLHASGITEIDVIGPKCRGRSE